MRRNIILVTLRAGKHSSKQLFLPVMSLSMSLSLSHELTLNHAPKFVTIWKQYVKLSINDVRITVEKMQNLYSSYQSHRTTASSTHDKKETRNV